MSAYLVSQETIQYLVSAMMSQRIVGPHLRWTYDREADTCKSGQLVNTDNGEASRVGQILWTENYRSICDRYAHHDNGECPIYEHSRWSTDHQPAIEPVQVIKACHCLIYQSCEHSGWKDSQALAILESLIASACHHLPGYEQASWGID